MVEAREHARNIKAYSKPSCQRNEAHLGHSSNHVIDRTPNRPQRGDVLPAALPDGERDNVLAVLGDGLELNVHVDMSEVLGELPAGTGDDDDAGLDGDGDSVGNGELFGGKDVSHAIIGNGRRSRIWSLGFEQSVADSCIRTIPTPNWVDFNNRVE